MMNYMYYNHNYFPGFGLLGVFFQIAWWALIIWLLMAVFRHFKGQNHRSENSPTDTALDILRQRYAKGEITKKEFDSMKKDIA